jgi:NADPH:quinone reductase-like Zn-dependent oxidoreductase
MSPKGRLNVIAHRPEGLKITTMRAARIHAWGSPEVVQIEDAPVPEPKQDEVLIQVRAASVNPVDWAVVQGYMKSFYSLPVTPGSDAAGDVVAVGSGVTHVSVGDAVYASTGGGSFAQFATVAGKDVARKPASLDYVAAAAVPIVAQTAWQALFAVGQLEAGQKVLIHAAAGGVGHIAVQLAKWRGAYVIGTASAENESFIRGLGADEFINYHTTRFEDVVQDADVVLVSVSGDTLDRSYSAVKRGGIVVTITGQPSEEKAKARGARTARAMRRNSNRAELDEITRLIDAGAVKPTVSAVYSLERIREALDAIATHHTRGKIVVTIPGGSR